MYIIMRYCIIIIMIITNCYYLLLFVLVVLLSLFLIIIIIMFIIIIIINMASMIPAQRHINGVVSKNNKYNNVGFGWIKRPF